MKKKIIKLLYCIASLIGVLIVCFFALVYTEQGRRIALNYIIPAIAGRGTTLEISGMNHDITKIDRISFRDQSGLELVFNGCRFQRYSLLERNIIYVENFSLNKQSQKTDLSQNDAHKNLCNQLRNILPIMRTIRMFVQGLSINTGEIRTDEKIYKLTKFQYLSEFNTDRVYFKLDERSAININFDWKNSKCVNSDVNFVNVFDACGSLAIINPESRNSQYKLRTNYKFGQIVSDGNFKNFEKEILVNNAFVSYKNMSTNLSGKIFVDDQKANLSSKIVLENFVDQTKTHPEIIKNVQDVIADINIKSDLKNGHNISISFSKNNVKQGDASIFLKDKKATLQANISWIDIFGYAPNSINISTEDFENFVANIKGKEFFAAANVKINQNIFEFDDIVFKIPKGHFVSTNSFVYNDGFKSGKCKFKFEDLSVFSKMLPLAGSLSGSISIENDMFAFDVKSPKLLYENYAFYGLNISGNATTAKVTAQNISYDQTVLKNFAFNKNSDRFSVVSKINDGTDLNVNGNIKNNEINLTANARNKLCSLKISDCILNKIDKSCSLKAKLSDKKSEGILVANVDSNQCKISAENFSLTSIGSLLDKKIPRCVVDGKINLSANNQIFEGQSNLSIYDLISKKNTIKISIDNKLDGMRINGFIKGENDDFSLVANYPIAITNKWKCAQLLQQSLSLSLKGKAHFENIFELPDGFKLAGLIYSDLKISGTFREPKVTGFINSSNTTIAVKDVLLKRGTISLIGRGNKFIAEEVEFIDYIGNKATATGFGTVFFSKNIPNIDANLALDFQNFRLFDTDDLKINISGKGAMTGALDNMKISGNVLVPFSELSCFGSGDDSHKYSGIVIENDHYINNVKNVGKSFFDYDINMECLKILVKGDIYNLQFYGDLHLGTFNQQATMRGQINLTNGKLDLFGKRMIFSRGIVTFFDEFPFKPEIDILCKKKINTMTAFLQISGEAGQNPEIDLYSKPNYPKDVILSQMLFGKFTKELSVGEAAQLAHAVAGLNRKGYIFSILNTLTGSGLVDSISFSTSDDSSSLYKNATSSNGNSINVSAGKYLSDNVFISVNRKEAETSFDVDISLDKNTSLKVNTKGEAGISWKYRY